jgi:hypothetical protein
MPIVMGNVTVGDGLIVHGGPQLRTRLAARPGGVRRLGDRVFVNEGTSL